MLDRQEIKAIYRSQLEVAPELPAEDIQWQYLLRWMPEQKGASILDAGCGNGKYALRLVKHGYSRVQGVDLFERHIVDSFEYRQASIDALPFEAAAFDFIYCFSVIFYLDDPAKGLQEFNRVLKPGGRLLLTAHTRYSLFTLWRVFKRFLGLPSTDHLRGVRFYSAGQYAAMLRRCGFRVLCLDGYRLSAFVFPLYRKAARVFQKASGISLPRSHYRPTNGRRLARVKSEAAYHSVIVAEKAAAMQM